MFLLIDRVSKSKLNFPWVESLREVIPVPGFVVPIPTVPRPVITSVFSSSELNCNFCWGVAVNIPTLSVLVSAVNTVPPTPTSKDIFAVRKLISKLPSMNTSFLKVAFS